MPRLLLKPGNSVAYDSKKHILKFFRDGVRRIQDFDPVGNGKTSIHLVGRQDFLMLAQLFATIYGLSIVKVETMSPDVWRYDFTARA